MRPVLAAITLSALVLGLAGCLNGDNSSGRAPEAVGEQPTDKGSSPDPGGDGDDSGNHTDSEEPADNGGDDGTGNGTDDDDTVSNPNTGDQTGPTPRPRARSRASVAHHGTRNRNPDARGHALDDLRRRRIERAGLRDLQPCAPVRRSILLGDGPHG